VPPSDLRGRAEGCMMALCRLFTTDWPTAFLQVFEDRSGAMVVAFDQLKAVAEGDLPAYMQQLVLHHCLVAEYKLTKDGTQWGLEDQESGSVFYLLWPPWQRHRFAGSIKQPLHHRSSCDSRSAACEMVPDTDSGLDLSSLSALSRSAAAAVLVAT